MEPGINPIVALNMAFELLMMGVASLTFASSSDAVSAGSAQDLTDKVFGPVVITFFVASIFWYWFYSGQERSSCSTRIIKTVRCLQGVLLCHLGVWMVMVSTRYCGGSYCSYRLVGGVLAVIDALVYLLASVSSHVAAAESLQAPPLSSQQTKAGLGPLPASNRAPSYENFAPPDYLSAVNSSQHPSNIV